MDSSISFMKKRWVCLGEGNEQTQKLKDEPCDHREYLGIIAQMKIDIISEGEMNWMWIIQLK